VPIEWPFLFNLAKVGKYFGFDAMSTMDLWFYITFILNAIFIYLAIFILTGDRWAGALFALPIIFQYSLAQKVAWGHLVLTFIAPIILSLSLSYKIMESILQNKKSNYGFGLIVGLCTFITFYTSYYYTVFSFLLHVSMIILFVSMHRLYKSKNSIIEITKKLAVPAIVGGFLGLLLNSHIVLGASGFHDGDINNRKFIGVSLYSARVMEFFKPLPDTVLGKFFALFKISFANQTIRGEVYSYQGSAIVLSLIFVLFFTLRSKNSRENLKKKTKVFFTSKSPELFFFCMAVIALFFTSKTGGTFVYYTLTKSLRAFSRMAPFATFFLVIYIVLWANKNLKGNLKHLFYILFFMTSFIESYQSDALTSLRNYTTSALKQKVDEGIVKTNEQVARICRRGQIEIAPEFSKDFLHSQWTIQYFLEIHDCSAINGSYIEQFTKQSTGTNLPTSGKMQLAENHWDGIDSLTVSEF
jgi:hypothetical protein